MKNSLIAILFTLLLAVNANAAILVMSQDGTYTTATSLSSAATRADCAGKTIVVTSALSSSFSNISSATVHSWPSDRTLRVNTGGSINPTTKFTGLLETTPEMFGTGTQSINLAIKALGSNGGKVTLASNKTYITDPIIMPAYPKVIDFQGAGVNSTILQPSGTNQPVIIMANPNSDYPSVAHRIGGLSVKSHASGSTSYAIDMRGMTGVTMHDIGYLTNGSGDYTTLFYLDDTVRTRDAWQSAATLGTCYANTIDGVYINHQTGPIYVVYSNNRAQSNWFKHFKIISIPDAGVMQQVFHFSRLGAGQTISDSLFNGVPQDVMSVTNNTLVENCYFEGVHGYVAIGNGTSFVTFKNCVFSDAIGPALWAKFYLFSSASDKAAHWTFDGCGIDPTGLNAIAVNSTVRDGATYSNIAIGNLGGGIVAHQIGGAYPVTAYVVDVPWSTLANGTYKYKVTVTTASGESLYTETNAVTISTSGKAVILTANPPNGATGFKVYGRSSGTETLMATIGNLIGTDGTLYTDLGSDTPDGLTSPPTVDTTGDVVTTGAATFRTAWGNFLTSGSGSPEGAVSAPQGSLYMNIAGGAGTSLYVKETGGNGRSGWVSK